MASRTGRGLEWGGGGGGGGGTDMGPLQWKSVDDKKA